MEKENGKYVVKIEPPGKQPISWCPGHYKVQNSTCSFPPSLGVTNETHTNAASVCINPGTLEHSKFPQKQFLHGQVTQNTFSDWCLWKTFLICLLACVITTAIGVLTVCLVNKGKNNTAPLTVHINLDDRKPAVVIPGTISLPTSQPTVTNTTELTTINTTITTLSVPIPSTISTEPVSTAITTSVSPEVTTTEATNSISTIPSSTLHATSSTLTESTTSNDQNATTTVITMPTEVIPSITPTELTEMSTLMEHTTHEASTILTSESTTAVISNSSEPVGITLSIDLKTRVITISSNKPIIKIETITSTESENTIEPNSINLIISSDEISTNATHAISFTFFTKHESIIIASPTLTDTMKTSADTIKIMLILKPQPIEATTLELNLKLFAIFISLEPTPLFPLKQKLKISLHRHKNKN